MAEDDGQQQGSDQLLQKYGFMICGTHTLEFPEMKEAYREMYIMKSSVKNIGDNMSPMLSFKPGYRS